MILVNSSGIVPELLPWDWQGRFSLAVVTKARAADPAGVVPDLDQPLVWWVAPAVLGEHTRAPYRVQVGERLGGPDTAPLWVSCTCAHGAHSGQPLRCSHVLRVLLAVLGSVNGD